MRNCLVAQSGGPTAVINASVVGVIEANKELKYYDNVYGGVNGIEGILKSKIINLSNLSDIEVNILKYTPSSALGSCRHKIKDFRVNKEEYEEFFNLLDKFEIQTFFYIGGNDSMDTVNKFSQYAKLKGINKQIIGIPKTIDNDLMVMDHTPGYGSAAKFIATTVLETYLDSSVYVNNGVFILETMGRDTGWLAASASLARINGKSVADFIYVPEVEFNEEKFLEDVKKRYDENNRVYIVASEGLKDANGKYIYEGNSAKKHDTFSHAQLGGVGGYLKQLVADGNITSRIKVLELGISQRAGMHNASETDINYAYRAGFEACKYSTNGDTGFVVAQKRVSQEPFEVELFKVDPSEIANHVKYMPKEWITQNNVTEEAYNYIKPLVEGTPKIVQENGLPKYIKLDLKNYING